MLLELFPLSLSYELQVMKENKIRMRGEAGETKIVLAKPPGRDSVVDGKGGDGRGAK